jgi:insulysin
MAGPGAGWTHVPAAGNRPAYYVFDTPIERSQQDDRQYRLIQLENGLNATLVSDPNGDKAAASLDVAVGHLFDPVNSLLWFLFRKG